MERSDSTAAFSSLTKNKAYVNMEKEIKKLKMTSVGQGEGFSPDTVMEKDMDGFLKIFQKYVSMDTSCVDWNGIEQLPDSTIKAYSDIIAELPKEKIQEYLSKLVIVKLNGGLGTSMGCTGPKSAIQVRPDVTFLDLTVQQVCSINKKYGVNVPLILMNSFNTHEDTKEIITKYEQVNVQIHSFLQSRHPRFSRDTLLPMAKSVNDTTDSWYPPGHGDVYESLYNSGLLGDFISEGKQYAFISNIDNLGACVDINILQFIMSSANKHEFIMEVTDKTRADVKGGTLVKYQGKVTLLEIAQVPKHYEDEFKSVNKFKIFNTNNLWVSLPAMRRVIEEDSLEMEIIVNNKSVNVGRTTTNVIQLERAAGAAIRSFEGSIGLNVPRSRFLPVKTTSDLLLVMSNLYTLTNGTLTMSARRSFPSVPLIKLGADFAHVRKFLQRFDTIPDLLELDHLTVSGDVNFGKSVTLKGTVIVIANHGDRIDIPPGAVLENKIVSGNLRILNH